MNNMVMLIGRLVKEPEKKEIDEKNACYIIIAVNRNFKNVEGVYETDFFNITLWDGIASNCLEYLHKGDLIGIKGRLQSSYGADDDGNIVAKVPEIIAEKVTFLSSKLTEKDERQDD